MYERSEIELVSLPNWRMRPPHPPSMGARFRVMCVTTPRALREGYHNIFSHGAPSSPVGEDRSFGFCLVRQEASPTR